MNAFPWLTLLTLSARRWCDHRARVRPHRDQVARSLALIFSFVALAITLLLWAISTPRPARSNFNSKFRGSPPSVSSITSASTASAC